MRVTKVKIGNGPKVAVAMQRDKTDGFLYADTDYKNEKIKKLLEKKHNEFITSVVNKTAKKSKTNNPLVVFLKCVLQENDSKLNDHLKSFFTSIKQNQSMSPELRTKIKQKLSHRFQDKSPVNLVEILSSLSSECDNKTIKEKLIPYKVWAEEFIKRKIKYLAKSIEKNSLDYSDGVSPRKQVLECFAKKLVAHELIPCLEDLACRYGIDVIIAEIETVINSYPTKPTQYDFFEFKRAIKKIIHDKQMLLLKKYAQQDMLQYGLELSKYVELYFPLKKSKKSSCEQNCKEEYIKLHLSCQMIKHGIQSQLKNATVQYLIQKGKLLKYGITNPTSKQLIDLKCKEAFALQFVNAVCFAANNLRNSLLPHDIQNDILGFNEIKKHLAKMETDDKLQNNLLNRFFTSIESLDSTEFVDNVYAIRGSIQKIRNNIIHFKINAGSTILNIQTYERFLNGNSGKSFVDNKFLVKSLKTEISLLSKAFAEKLKSGRLFEYYNQDDLITVFSEDIHLSSNPLPFIPSFKNVFNYGTKYQESKQSEYNVKNYIIDNFDEETVRVFRFAMKQIYEVYFIHRFMEDSPFFIDIVGIVLKANKIENQNNYARAFNEVRGVSENEKPLEYLKSIHSELINEENKKSADPTSENKTGNFQKFLWTLFAVGFDRFLQINTNFAFVKNPQYNLKVKINDVTEQFSKLLNIQHSIQPSENSTIAFWTFCKMLDASHLNELNNQISKLMQVIGADKHLSQCQEIIKLSILYTDNSFTDKTQISDIQPYLAFTPDDEPYLQGKEKTCVPFANVMITEKYATKILLSAILEPYKVTKAEVDDWKAIKKSIATLQNTRTNLHRQWVESLNKTKKPTSSWGDADESSYKKTCQEIERYNWLDNKVHLTHVKSLHNLLVEILGRFAGFVALFDRDFQFANLSASEYRESDNYRVTEFVNFKYLLDNNIEELKKKYNVTANSNVTEFPQDEKENSKFRKHLTAKRDFYNENPNKIATRNFIAHFNFISKREFSILDLLAQLRNLMSYDRKLKNAVTKSFIDILDKHNIDIKLKLDHTNNKITIIAIKPKPTVHLKGTLTIKKGQDYSEMVKQLIEFKQEH